MSSHASTGAVHRGQDLGTINEDPLTGERTKSPEPYPLGIETHDFTSTSPRRRSTHPQFSLRKSETTSIGDGDPKFVRRATRPAVGASRVKKSSRQFFNFKRTGSREGIFLKRTPIRYSTSDTNNSVITNASASFEETAVWDQKALLALDGGGIRGYSALLILEALMKEIGTLETTSFDEPARSSFHPLSPTPCIATDSESVNSRDRVEAPQTESSSWLPCHYFDYIAGTSTGGLISIMLGRLRMNIDDCIRDYEYFGERVFGHSRWFHIRSLLFWPRDKYDHRVLEEAVQKVVETRGPHVASFPGGRNFAFDENRCRTVVLAYERQKRKVSQNPYIFRTYKNLHRSEDKEEILDRNPGLAHDIPIWQVARATSAAPTYFEPLKTGDHEYLDGGMGANNPCEEIQGEVWRMNNNSKNCVRVILSIGTGRNNMVPFGGQGLSRYWHLFKWAQKRVTDSQEPHVRMKARAKRENFTYFRLNVEQGLDKIKLDEWRVKGELRTTVGRAVNRLRSLRKSSPHTRNSNKVRSDENSTAEKADCLPPKNKTLDSIRTNTNSYLAREDVKKWLRDCAEILVKIRRGRAEQDRQRWERACFGAWYQCRVPGCQRGEKEYDSPEALMSHLKSKHSASFSGANGWDEAKLNETVDKFKILVR